MRVLSTKGSFSVLLLSLFMIVSMGSCKSSQTKGYAWTDLKHARELDKKKGKRSKKYQKNVTKVYDY